MRETYIFTGREGDTERDTERQRAGERERVYRSFRRPTLRELGGEKYLVR